MSSSNYRAQPAPPLAHQQRTIKPMKTSVQLQSVATNDTRGTTLVVQTDDRKYLFGNLSENTQRALRQRGVRLSNISDIFVTGKTEWGNTGGLLGLLLTLGDGAASTVASQLELHNKKIDKFEKRLESGQVKPKEEKSIRERLEQVRKFINEFPKEAEEHATVNLHGGPNLAHTLATARRFVCRTGMPVRIQEFGDNEAEIDSANPAPLEPSWSDDRVKVWALPIFPSSSSTAASPPQNRSKRSYHEFQETAGSEARTEEQRASQRREGRAKCQYAVSEMFSSNWKPDLLEEVPLVEAPPSALFVRNPENGEVEEYRGPRPGDIEELPDMTVLVRKPWPGSAIKTLPSTSPSQCSMSYIVRTHDVRGKLDAKKAEELGVEKRSDYRLLVGGESVTSKDGETVTPEMVLAPSHPGKGVAVVDLPSVDYVENLVSRPEWKSDTITKGIEAFVWILGDGVGDSPRLRQFLASMPQVKHLFSSRDHCSDPLVFQQASRIALQLGQIDPNRYPVLTHNAGPRPPISGPDGDGTHIQAAEAGLTIDMEPTVKLEMDSQQERPLNIRKVKKRISSKVLRLAADINESMKQPHFKQRLTDMRKSLHADGAEVITLGTGSSSPSFHRNVSGTLLRIPGRGCYIFDCGEGTLNQLKRTLTPSEFKKVLQDLKMIWISHMHADHHLGMVSIIKAWYEEAFGAAPPPSSPEPESDVARMLGEKRLFVVSATPMFDWLGEYACVENYGYDRIFPIDVTSPKDTDAGSRGCGFYNVRDKDGRIVTDSSGTPEGTHLSFDDPESPLTPLLQEAIGFSSLRCVPVRHCQGSRAVSVTFPSGFKFSYSGDCRPAKRFVEIGKDSTVLVHEATFEDSLQREALAKRHSTISEALTIGKRMQAKVVVLTHFSQRYMGMAEMGAGKGSSKSSPPPQSPVRNAVLDIPVADDGPEEDVASSSDVEAEPEAPVILANDYMRLKVEDALIAEAYMPAARKHLELSC